MNDEVENLFASNHKVEVKDLKNILGGSTDGLRRGGTIVVRTDEAHANVPETIEKMNSDVK